MKTKYKSKSILMVEDDPDDIYLISEAIDECQLDAEIFIVQDGEDLMDFLHNEGKFTNKTKYPLPDLILLDLNMPKKDGREALHEIKSEHRLRSIPVVILTTSQSEKDIEETYASGASGFVTKPASFADLRDTVEKIGNYWLSIVSKPDDPEP